ncbi:MAG: HD domain-containing protein [Candidatus Margulisbacteria bacterium]|nr:HD domain-containing protein [Candidatus Margulisiibacteriota bacterium]
MLYRLIYRLKQFYFGMLASYNKADAAFANSYLNSEELALFNQLPGFEKKHAVVVAKKMLDLALYNPELDQRKLVRLGLLHDIGKVMERSTVLSKSILVIIRYFFPAFYEWLAAKGKSDPRFKKFYIHRHHGEVGADLLAKIGVSGEYFLMIKKHDPRIEPFGPDDPIELKILQDADSTY